MLSYAAFLFFVAHKTLSALACLSRKWCGRILSPTGPTRSECWLAPGGSPWLSDFGWKEPGMSATRWYQKSLKDIGGADDLQSLVEVCQHQGHTGLYINDVSEHDVAICNRWSVAGLLLFESWSRSLGAAGVFVTRLIRPLRSNCGVNWSPNFEVSHKAAAVLPLCGSHCTLLPFPKAKSSNNSAIFWIH